MDLLAAVFNALSPVLVALVGAYSAITVAKLTKMQKDIKTNHGTSNIGEAVDIIRARVDSISLSQARIMEHIDHLKRNDNKTASKICDIEEKIDTLSKESLKED